MLSPLILATSSICARSSTSTNRHGWLLKWDGAIPATSTSRRWCSDLTGSGKKGPFVVLRRRTTSRKSTAHPPQVPLPCRSPQPRREGRDHLRRAIAHENLLLDRAADPSRDKNARLDAE